MTSWVREQPFVVAFAVLLVIVFCRAQATYWLGRGARAGSERTRLARWLAGAQVRRATDRLQRWGLPLIPLSFLTIGFQTTVNAGAGLLHISWARYTLAMLPGCVAWALIYATVGMAAVAAWLRLAALSPWTPWLCALVIVVGGGLFWWRLQRPRR